jgi:hypothetical protein
VPFELLWILLTPFSYLYPSTGDTEKNRAQYVFLSDQVVELEWKVGSVGQIVATFQADDVCVRCYNPE